jgi:glucose/arabinose dehydrogenase
MKRWFVISMKSLLAVAALLPNPLAGYAAAKSTGIPLELVKLPPGNMFPLRYRNQVFIAEHGSWNRSVPIGYRITLAVFDKNNTARYEVFAHGWLNNNKAWGRPVDIIVINDGSLLVSDDRAGVIYRISYGQ